MLMKEPDRRTFAKVEAAARLSRYGGDCYGYCMLASGHVDLVIETELKPYDILPLIPDHRRRRRRRHRLGRRLAEQGRPSGRRGRSTRTRAGAEYLERMTWRRAPAHDRFRLNWGDASNAFYTPLEVEGNRMWMIGIGSALPPLEKGRVGVGILLVRRCFDPHPVCHSASKTRVNELTANRPPFLRGGKECSWRARATCDYPAPKGRVSRVRRAASIRSNHALVKTSACLARRH